LLTLEHGNFDPYLFSSVFEFFGPWWRFDDFALKEYRSCEVDKDIAAAREESERRAADFAMLERCCEGSGR
jgi:hypothetical protein